jgi:Domain of unknown function (DUF5666)
MNKNIRIVLAGLLTTAIVLAPAVSSAQEKPKTPPAGSAEAKPAAGPRAIPFRGTVAAVDKTAMTVTVGERVFHVASETKVFKNNQPATVGEIAVGDNVTGNYTKADDGKLTAKLLRAGLRAEPAKPPKSSKDADKQNDKE